MVPRTSSSWRASPSFSSPPCLNSFGPSIWPSVASMSSGAKMSERAPLITFELVTLFPEMLDGFLATSLLGRAITAGLVRIERTNPRDFAPGRHRSVDDTPCGGGPGMILRVEPFAAALDDIVARRGPARKILLSPQGAPLDQTKVR